ncbi:MAG: TonB-dependent receptor, partial [Acidobacteriota bacterium]
MVNRTLFIVLLSLTGSLVSLPLFGAQDSGNIFGTVTDTSGSALPGSTVILTGFGATQVQVTDSNGGFRFLGLDPGDWRVKAQLDGFSTVEQPNVVVSVNRNTEIVLSLSGAIQESITVTAESPLLDERKVSAGTTISQVELEKIPSTRDPWAVMQQAPGVLTDRINVGGNLSGTQQFFTGAGTDKTQNAYYVDGGDITDRFGTGGFSSTYFDCDQFSEMQLHTGGTDVTREVPGVSINLVTKRGSNEFRGSARFLLTDPDGYFGALKQGNDDLDPNDLGPGQSPENFGASQVDRNQEYGFEAGGPLWRNRLWAWASWGFNDLNSVAPNGSPDRIVLENTAIKLNVQFSPANTAVVSFNNGDKRGENRGAGPDKAPDSLWNQRGPTGITKIEDSHVFGSSFFLSGQYVHVDGGFSFASTGGCGPVGQEWTVGADGIQHGQQCGSTRRR